MFLHRRRNIKNFSDEELDSRLKNGLILHMCKGHMGKTLIDSSGNNLHATFNVSTASPVASNGFKNTRSAIKFEGVVENAAYINPDSRFDFGTGNFSFSFWLYNNKSGAPAGAEGVIGTVTQFGQGGYTISQFTSQTNLRLYLNGNDTSRATTSLPTKDWSHWTIIRDGGSIYWYMNGNLDATTTGHGATSFNSGGVGFAFGLWYADYLLGYAPNVILDDFRMYNRALSSAEAKLLADPNLNIAQKSKLGTLGESIIVPNAFFNFFH